MRKIVLPFVRSPYNYDVLQISDDTSLDCQDESLAVQSARDEVDINMIMKRYGLGAELPVGARLPTFGDFDGINDYQSAANAVIEAQKSFMLMPAGVRERFHNSAQEFLEFTSNPSNYKEAVSLGMIDEGRERARLEAEAAAEADRRAIADAEFLERQERLKPADKQV